jgi:hypothetical protein
MALNLVAAITLWNTAYLDRALRALEERGTPVPDIYPPHISPLGWEHITITGPLPLEGIQPHLGAVSDPRLEANRQEPRICLAALFLPTCPVWPGPARHPARLAEKYAALINNGLGTPVTSLHYFTSLLDETRSEISTGFWSYVEQKVRAVEQAWNGSFGSPEPETK